MYDRPYSLKPGVRLARLPVRDATAATQRVMRLSGVERLFVYLRLDCCHLVWLADRTDNCDDFRATDFDATLSKCFSTVCFEFTEGRDR